jgi:hypothetical protein
MIRIPVIFAALVAVAVAPWAHGAVTLSNDVNPPVLGAYDQSQLLDDATIPGGTAPGGGTYNSQAYTDNVGPVGQTFTAPATKHLYALTGVAVKGAGDSGTVIDAAGVTWGVRISKVTGTTLTPLKTVTGIPTLTAAAAATDWVTLSFTGTDAATLDASQQYAFEIYTSDGYFGIDATQGDAAYAGGTAFNSAGPGRAFTDNTLGNLANHGYDRTFVAQLTAPPGGPGDVDNNGLVNLADYNIIRTNLEKPVTIFTSGDLNGDSYVDLNDFRRWRSAAPPAVAASVGIPEPSTAALSLCGALLAAAGVRRREARRAER